MKLAYSYFNVMNHVCVSVTFPNRKSFTESLLNKFVNNLYKMYVVRFLPFLCNCNLFSQNVFRVIYRITFSFSTLFLVIVIIIINIIISLDTYKVNRFLQDTYNIYSIHKYIYYIIYTIICIVYTNILTSLCFLLFAITKVINSCNYCRVQF